MSRRDKRPQGLSRVYEGAEVLGALLRAAGSELDADGCRARFQAAVSAGEQPSTVFPALFPKEPRFADPEQARRLYGNLFGLWDLVASGGRIAEPAPPRERAPPAKRPEPVVGKTIAPEFVEAAWRHLEELPPREIARLRDRYEESQPQLAEWVRETAPSAESALDTADALAFELWAIEDFAFGGLPGKIALGRLQALQVAAPPPSQAALWAYAAEALTEAELDETAPISGDDRSSIEKVLVAVIAAMDELRALARN